MKKFLTYLAFLMFALVFSQNTVISMTGDAVGGWTVDTDLTTTDGIHYSKDNVVITTGGIQFRENHAWTNTWGEWPFPNGKARAGGQVNVPVDRAGTYNVTFNLNTKIYTFSTNNFPKISIVAASLGWENGEIDLTTTDGITYTLQNQTIPAGDFKFRLEHSWSYTWGGTDFPSGTGTLIGVNAATDDGSTPSIVATEGTYDITFNRDTGEYSFTQASLSTKNSKKKVIAIYPTRSKDIVNFSEEVLSLSIYDETGKLVKKDDAKNTSINISGLKSGIYFIDLKLSNGDSLRKKIIKE